MPDVTLQPSDLPADHPARTLSGRWTARARRLIENRTIPSRGRRHPTWGLTEPVNPIRNTRLFYRIADEIEVFPEGYRQDEWDQPAPDSPCGIAFCVAGHAAHFTGWKPASAAPSMFVRAPRYRQPVAIGRAARWELGLTAEEANVVFDGQWAPRRMTVPDALRALGDGASVADVTSRRWIQTWFSALEDHVGTARATGRMPVYR